jgi:hypothetical protein
MDSLGNNTMAVSGRAEQRTDTVGTTLNPRQCPH